MKTKVIWTTFARNELTLIYQYLLDNTSGLVAYNLIQDILDVSQLETFPLSGAIELNLKYLEYEFRYIIRGHNKYKLIYKYEDNIVHIVDVFDCRKDPKQMKKRNK